MKLYYATVSGNSHKVRILLALLKVAHDLHAALVGKVRIVQNLNHLVRQKANKAVGRFQLDELGWKC